MRRRRRIQRRSSRISSLRIRRDKDYRGKRRPVDWSHLVYQARRRQPGALEVLLDAIREWFPEQFETAKKEALLLKEQNSGYGVQFYVGFDGRIARRRFEQEPRLIPSGENYYGRKKDIRGYYRYGKAASKISAGSESPFAKMAAVRSPFDIYYPRQGQAITERLRLTRPTGRAAQPMTASSPPPYTAIVFSTEGKRGTERPKHSGSLPKARVPVLYLYQGEDEQDYVDNYTVYIRGKGSAAWARQRNQSDGDGWEIVENENEEGARIILDADRTLRQHGFRNRVRVLEYPPSRNFFRRST